MKCSNTLKRVFASKHFRTLLTGALALWFLALSIVSCAIFYRTKARLHKSIQEQLYNVTLSISDMISRAQTNAVTVGNLSSVRKALKAPAYCLDDYLDMAEDITSTMAIYEYLSVDVFIESTQKIYIFPRGLYSYDDYPDPSIIEMLHTDQPYELWSVKKRYPLYYPQIEQDETLVYIRQLPIYSSMPEGYVVFHIPMEFIRSMIRQIRPDCPGTLLINFDGTTIFSDDSMFEFGSAFPSGEEVSEYAGQMGGTVISSSLNFMENCCFILPNSVLWTHFFSYFTTTCWLFLLFLLLILVCAVVYCGLMLGPLEQILHQTAAPVLHQGGDEYQQLSRTVSDLSSCIDLLTDELQRNLQSIQERHIIDLTANYTDVRAQKARYEEIGISLPYPHFAVILAGCSDIEGFSGLSNKEQLKLLLLDQIKAALSGIGMVYSANLAEEQLMLLVNSRSDTMLQQIQKACSEVTEQLRDLLPQPPTFSVGSCTAAETAVPYLAYQQARRNIAFSRGSEDGGLLLADADAPILPSADGKTAERLTELLLDHDLPGIERILTELFRSAIQDCNDTDASRRFAISCLCVTLTRMLDLELDVVPEQASSVLKKLSHAASADACIRLLLDYFCTVINGEKKLPQDAEDHVRKAVDYIHTHYTENLTIPQIAESVALSSIYLNKLFKLSTGRTISDYLNLYRCEKAKQMLEQTELSLNEISSRLGYNDVRSLVRFFRKYNDITPGEYRQNLSAQNQTI